MENTFDLGIEIKKISDDFVQIDITISGIQCRYSAPMRLFNIDNTGVRDMVYSELAKALRTIFNEAWDRTALPGDI
jgi:hypothetical protein